jgi:hypothetical protein
MTLREKQIDEFANSQVDCEFFNEDLYEGIIIGAKWSDEHPDSKHTYTKQQLMDMGFAFTSNCDIVTPDKINESLKKFFKYQKQKFIENSVKYLEANFPDIENVGGWYKESFINNFRKAMEE